MKKIHCLQDTEIDFSNCILNHSGDETVFYKEVEGVKLPLSFYYPPNYHADKRYPVFVFIHGGGWNSHKIFQEQHGWQGDYLGFLARYYAEKGFVAVSIDYRLLEEKGQKEHYQLIDLCKDCEDAVSYLVAHSENYGLDFNHSVVLGESAGGYLAAALATFAYEERPVFSHAILVNAITDLFDSHWKEYVPQTQKTNLEKAYMLSPLYRISSVMPKTLLIHGMEDSVVRPRHSQSFYDEMMLHNKECELHWIEETNHAFLLVEYMLEQNKTLAATSVSVKIIDKWLEQLID